MGKMGLNTHNYTIKKSILIFHMQLNNDKIIEKIPTKSKTHFKSIIFMKDTKLLHSVLTYNKDIQILKGKNV